MFEFIDFILKLWYNSPPENTLKIVACSGVSSGCFVYYVCKFLEKRKKSMGVLDEEKLNPDIKLGSKVRIVKKYKGTEFYYACRNAEISDECTVETIDDSNPSYRLINSKKDYCYWFKPSEIELVPESKEAPKTVPNPKELAVGDRVKVINVEGRNELVQKTLGAIGKVVRIDRDGDHKVEFGDPINDWWYYPKHEIEFVPEVIAKEEPKLASIEPKKEEKRIPQIGDTVRVNYPSNKSHHGKIGILSENNSRSEPFKVIYPDGDYGLAESLKIFEFVSSPETPKVAEETKVSYTPKENDIVEILPFDNSLISTSYHSNMKLFVGVKGKVTGDKGLCGRAFEIKFDTDKGCGRDNWYYFPEHLKLIPKEDAQSQKTKEVPKFKVGDYVKVTSKKYDWVQKMDILLGKTIKIIKTDYNGHDIIGFSPLSKSTFEDREFGWVFNPLILEPSTLEAYNLDNNITQQEKEKTMEYTWTLFSTEIPTRRDVVISDDAKSWRYKTQEELKTEPKGTETMKTETQKQAKIKLNWRPITNTEDLEDGDVYFVKTSNENLETAIYSIDEDDEEKKPSESFLLTNDAGDDLMCDDVAFYIPIEELYSLVESPSEAEIEKVLKEEENQEEFKSLTMTDLAENFSSYSKEKQAEVVAYLRSKGIPTQV